MNSFSEHINQFVEPKEKGVQKYNGVLGTILFHLVVAIIFMMFKIADTTKKIQSQEIVVDFTEEVNDVEEEIAQQEKEKQEMIEQLARYELMQDLKNIPVNVANKAEDISTDNYVNQLKEELGMDDYDVKSTEDADLAIPENKKNNKKELSTEKQAYHGPTTIYFDLPERSERYLHVPVYLCQSSGRVTLNIRVDRQGYVLSASLNQSLSDVFADCLVDAAIKSAKRSRFNTNQAAEEKQSGTITYLFMPQ